MSNFHNEADRISDRTASSALRIVSPSSFTQKMMEDIAEQYCRTPNSQFPDIHSFQRWIAEAYSRLPMPIEFVDYDPYRSLAQMQAEVNSSGILRITTRNNESLFDPKVNLMFRAVHDTDHIRNNCDFGIHGEQQACRVITNRCRDELGKTLLFSEILGQACVARVRGDFEEQKYVRFPRRMRERALDALQ